MCDILWIKSVVISFYLSKQKGIQTKN